MVLRPGNKIHTTCRPQQASAMVRVLAELHYVVIIRQGYSFVITDFWRDGQNNFNLIYYSLASSDLYHSLACHNILIWQLHTCRDEEQTF